MTFDPLPEASVEAAAEQIEKRQAESPDYFVDAHSLTPDEQVLTSMQASQQASHQTRRNRLLPKLTAHES